MDKSRLLVACLFVANVANAQPGVAPVSEQPPAVPADDGIASDANADHAWLSPTALTAPQGSWSFSDTELLFVSLGYAVTDRVQLSATTLLPVFDEMPTFFLASVKARVLEVGRLRAALQVNGIYFDENIDAGENFERDDSDASVMLGGVLTYCFDDGCHSHASGYAAALFGWTESSGYNQGETPIFASASVVARFARHVKVVLELDTGYVAGAMDASVDSYLGWYGVRFTSRNIGVDLGFVKPLCDGCDDDDFKLGFPFVSMTYRTTPDR